jgi:hypothetical protein
MSARARVYFALTGDDFDPDEITNQLGVAPTSKHRTGDVGRYKPRLDFSLWELSTEETETLDIYELVACLYSQLGSKALEIRRLVDACRLNAVLAVVLWIDTNQNESAPGLGFDEKVISFLHETGASIDIDIYRFDSRDK